MPQGRIGLPICCAGKSCRVGRIAAHNAQTMEGNYFGNPHPYDRGCSRSGSQREDHSRCRHNSHPSHHQRPSGQRGTKDRSQLTIHAWCYSWLVWSGGSRTSLGTTASGLPTILELVATNAFTRTYAVVPLQTTLDQHSGGPLNCG